MNVYHMVRVRYERGYHMVRVRYGRVSHGKG